MKSRRIILCITACAGVVMSFAALVAWQLSVVRSPIEVDLARPGSVGDVAKSVRKAADSGPWVTPREVTIRVDERVRIHDMLLSCDVVERPGGNDEVIAITEPLSWLQLKLRVRNFADGVPSDLLTDDARGFSRASAIAQAKAIRDDELPLIVMRLHTYPYTVEVVIRPGFASSTYVLQYVVSSPTR